MEDKQLGGERDHTGSEEGDEGIESAVSFN